MEGGQDVETPRQKIGRPISLLALVTYFYVLWTAITGSSNQLNSSKSRAAGLFR